MTSFLLLYCNVLHLRYTWHSLILVFHCWAPFESTCQNNWIDQVARVNLLIIFKGFPEVRPYVILYGRYKAQTILTLEEINWLQLAWWKPDWDWWILPLICFLLIMTMQSNFYRDEEYDRGKRKKVRSSKNSFGGPNPFQEVATTKAQLKKAKMDQNSSGNRPYRIWRWTVTVLEQAGYVGACWYFFGYYMAVIIDCGDCITLKVIKFRFFLLQPPIQRFKPSDHHFLHSMVMISAIYGGIFLVCWCHGSYWYFDLDPKPWWLL